MGTKRELKAFIVYLTFIAVAETATAFIDPGYGLFLHSLILVSLLALSAFWRGANPSSNLFLSLSLAPLIRIISLSLPLIYLPRYTWYLVASVPVLAATLISMRLQGMKLADAGIALRKPLAQAGIALTGIPFGVIEYSILKPEPLAVGLQFLELITLAGALILSTGFVEELVFRGVLQKSAVDVMGEKAGVLGVTAVFASLHIGWLSILDVAFVFSIGLFFAVLTLKTGSIAGVSLSHGITNVILFLMMPSS
jgi:hypothetical protein